MRRRIGAMRIGMLRVTVDDASLIIERGEWALRICAGPFPARRTLLRLTCESESCLSAWRRIMSGAEISVPELYRACQGAVRAPAGASVQDMRRVFAEHAADIVRIMQDHGEEHLAVCEAFAREVLAGRGTRTNPARIAGQVPEYWIA